MSLKIALGSAVLLGAISAAQSAHADQYTQTFYAPPVKMTNLWHASQELGVSPTFDKSKTAGNITVTWNYYGSNAVNMRGQLCDLNQDKCTTMQSASTFTTNVFAGTKFNSAKWVFRAARLDPSAPNQSKNLNPWAESNSSNSITFNTQN